VRNVPPGCHTEGTHGVPLGTMRAHMAAHGMGERIKNEAVAKEIRFHS
jgi:hypothetical protein